MKNNLIKISYHGHDHFMIVESDNLHDAMLAIEMFAATTRSAEMANGREEKFEPLIFSEDGSCEFRGYSMDGITTFRSKIIGYDFVSTISLRTLRLGCKVLHISRRLNVDDIIN